MCVRSCVRDFALDSKIRMFKPQEDRPFQTLDPMQSTSPSFCAIPPRSSNVVMRNTTACACTRHADVHKPLHISQFFSCSSFGILLLPLADEMYCLHRHFWCAGLGLVVFSVPFCQTQYLLHPTIRADLRVTTTNRVPAFLRLFVGLIPASLIGTNDSPWVQVIHGHW